MTTQKLLTIGLIALVITVLLAVGGALFKSQDTILSTSSVPSTTTEASSGGYEIINGISVPPEPDPAVNNATLAGVDMNGNGVRDDVERVIAERYGSNQDVLKAAMISARGHQMILLADKTNRDSAQEALRSSISAGVCATQVFTASGLNVTEELNQTFSRTYNTTQRLDHKASVSAIAGVFAQSVTAINCQEWDSFSPNQAETINGITVPPEPDPAVNNATLAGVDVNGNGVRDDVERLIAQRWPSNFAAGMDVARHTRLLMTQKGSELPLALTEASFCAMALRKVDESVLMNALLNSNERYSVYYANVGLTKTYDCEDTDKSPFSQAFEIINGITVPPEPDPELNNSTLAGVDVNTNGVRDDVERVLARKAPNVGDFNDLIKYFAAYQRITTDPTPNNREAAVAQYRAITCSLGKGVPITHLANLMRQNEIDTLALVFNTSERIAKRTATGKMLDGGYDGEELLCE